ncbi:MAG: chromosome segregation protein SMC, partial [Oscillospiraceae bacterium]|nr:chromosome segregation protein SMC [Oscillospiraceae bacterium]
EREAGQEREGGLQGQIEARLTHMEELSAQLDAATAEIAALLAQAEEISHRAGGGAQRLDALRAGQADAQETVSALRAERSSLSAAAGEMEARRRTAAADAEARAAELTDADGQLAELDTKLTESAERLDGLQNVIGGYELRRASRQKKVDALRARHGQLTMDTEALRSRTALLREMEREHEGHSRAVKSVLQDSARGALRGVHGTLASLLRADDRCAVAVEIALGPALQNIVVDREEDAKAAIEALRRQDAGRATFLPLSAIRGRMLEENGLEREPGFAGIAADLVAVDGKYREIVDNLLGRTVVMENMDAAIGLARRRGQRFRIVTLDGQVILPGGAMTGGSVGKSVGLLSRKNETERLEKKLAENREALEAMARELSAAERELSAVAYDCDVALAERRQAEDEALSLRSAREHKAVWRDGIRAGRDTLAAETEAIAARLAQNAEQVQTLQIAEEGQNARLTRLADEIAALSQGQSGLQTEGTALAEQIAALRAQSAALGAERESDRRSAEELSALRAQLIGDQSQREESFVGYERKSAELSAQIGVKEGELTALAGRAKEAKEALEALYAARRELEGRRVQADRQAREKNEENLRLERERSRLEAQKVSGEAEEKAIIDKLWENYQLTHTTALELRTPMDSAAKANRRVGELKSAIAALGPPNIGAIDEYSRVAERYEYLTSQRDDAEKAKNDLLGIIDGLVGQMREIFVGQFALINEKFGQTFKEIFGGGDAHLELEDPEDPLGCGVEIRAQPPGKRMRSITLLSGGEKSLVAIALYFAIFKVRPAPFCILDEVDHDLDDVNVARYAAYLRRLATDTQFVVVTHRRGTMEAAEALYGVTTQEEGVSKILSLRLQDAEKSLGMTLA